MRRLTEIRNESLTEGWKYNPDQNTADMYTRTSQFSALRVS